MNFPIKSITKGPFFFIRHKWMVRFERGDVVEMTEDGARDAVAFYRRYGGATASFWVVLEYYAAEAIVRHLDK